MTKVALLTIWREKNYGAELQAYATVRALTELGVEVEMIDFRLSDDVKLSAKGRIARFISNFSIENKKFKKFWKKYIPAGKYYQSLDELRKDPPKADIYIVGSDQVWNPEITRNKAAAYFLDFGSDNIRRASYASSFGTSQWKGDETLTNIANQRLRKFIKIGCREASGVKILENTFGVNASNVLDPIFLHKGYPEFTGNLTPQNTLVYYPLSKFDEVGEFSKKLAGQLGLKFVNANKKTYILNKIVWNRPSIQQWVKSIAEASFVITSSFHGLALSVLFHRQFAILQNSNRERSSRVTDLLKILDLDDRYYNSVEELNKAKPWEKIIDYERVENLLNIYYSFSWSFLKDILHEHSVSNTLSNNTL